MTVVSNYTWSTPKTTWVKTDFINYTDYMRIRNNIGYLYDFASALYATMGALTPMVVKNGYSNYAFASEWNALEANLHMIFDSIKTSDIGTRMTFFPNGRTLDYAELNRIESATLSMYNELSGQASGRPMLAFTLNGGTIQV